jgi:AraC-like DNA-binding protein
MLESITIDRFNNTDLNMYQCGTQDCVPGHSYGPAVRDHFLIHYILEGKGIFQVGSKTYPLNAGQGFLICPGIITYYQADFDNPWNYSWVGFNGLMAGSFLQQANLTVDNPIFTYTKDDFMNRCFEEMLATKELKKGRELRLLSLLYRFLSLLIEECGVGFFNGSTSRKEFYIKKAVEFIEMNYSSKISIGEIAYYIGLDRSYLGSIFKDYTESSLQYFLINFRLNKACELMRNKSLSIGDISRSVGYDDPLLFSKVFKKMKGVSPKNYKNSLS